MPLQNRVTPLGDLIADPARGLVYGNRGCLHDTTGTIRRRYAVRRWIACRLEFRGWQRGPLLQPGRFTELFFLDEATAFAAGHRPCALCRHDDYRRFVAFWRDRHGGPAGADDIDARLHEERHRLGVETPAASRSRTAGSARWRLRHARRGSAPGARRRPAAMVAVGLRPTGRASPRPGGGDHAAVATRPACDRMGGRRAAHPPVGRLNGRPRWRRRHRPLPQRRPRNCELTF